MVNANKYNILLIIGSSGIGGGEKVFYSLLKYLNKDKYSIFVACPPGGAMIDNFKEHAQEVRTFNFMNWLNPCTIISLKRYMKEKRISMVHTHMYNADFMGTIAARLSGVPVRICTVHGYNFTVTGQRDLQSVRNRFFSFIYRAVYILAGNVIAVCRALEKDLVTRRGIKVPKNIITVIYNGIDYAEMESNGANAVANSIIDSGSQLIGVISGFDRVKGHRVLLKAIPAVTSRHPNVKFLLVGDGKDRDKVEMLAVRDGITKNIVFMGVVRNVSSVILACDFIVLPSLYEGFPLVVLEAMFLGKPVVATRVGGVPEIVQEDVTGYLVPPNDYVGLSKAIIKMLDDKALASRMGVRAKELMREKFGDRFKAQEMVRETETFYQSLLCSVKEMPA